MIKFDCGRAPGLEKRLKREPEEADRTEAKVEVVGVRSAVLGWMPTARLSWGLGRCPREGCPRGGPLGPGSLGLPCKGGGQHPLGVSASSAGHWQPSRETQPPPNP